MNKDEVNELVRQLADDPDVVDTWTMEQMDAVLEAFGSNVASIEQRCVEGPHNLKMEALLEYCMRYPHLIDSFSPHELDRILAYLGATANPAQTRSALQNAGVDLPTLFAGQRKIVQ